MGSQRLQNYFINHYKFAITRVLIIVSGSIKDWLEFEAIEPITAQNFIDSNIAFIKL